MTATLYASNSGSASTSDLFTVDPATGHNLSDVGALGVALTGLAIDSAGNAVAVTSNKSGSHPHSFGHVDLSTGAFTFIHDYGGTNLNDITFDGEDVLWGVEQGGDIVTVDPATGATTEIGYTGLGSIFGGGLTFSAGGALLLCYRSQLYLVNQGDGSLTLIGTLGTVGNQNVGSMATSPDTNVIYGVTPQDGRLYTINEGTGAATLVGSTTIAEPDGLAFTSRPRPPDFNLHLAPSSIIVPPGVHTEVFLTSTVVSGDTESITLSSTHDPEISSVSFGTNPIVAGGGSRVFVNVDPTATDGTYHATLIGTGTLNTHSIILTVQVSTGDIPGFHIGS